MTDEREPNAQAWKRPPKSDPFPDPAPEEEPLVRRRRSDGPEERRRLDALEAATKRALADEAVRLATRSWLYGGNHD